MEDLKQKIKDTICKPQLAVLATIKDALPWCRYVFIVADDKLNVRCASFIDARKVDQINHNSEVHLTCGVASLDDQVPYLQIQGNASISTDQADKDAFWNPGLQKIFESKEDPNYAVITVKPYRIEYCVPGKHHPEVLEL